MELWIIRHAIAEERRAGLAEEDRQLTARGAARFERCVRALGALGVRFDHVLTSPWTRAAQTAAMLAPIASREPQPLEALCRDPSPALLEALEKIGDGAVALVGHEPWSSELTSWLVCGEPEDGDARFRLKKGGVAHLRGTPRPAQMQMRALLPPKVLLAGC